MTAPVNDNITAVSAFLAMATKQHLMLNGHTAGEVWNAWLALNGWDAATGAKLLDALAPMETLVD